MLPLPEMMLNTVRSGLGTITVPYAVLLAGVVVVPFAARKLGVLAIHTLLKLGWFGPNLKPKEIRLPFSSVGIMLDPRPPLKHAVDDNAGRRDRAWYPKLWFPPERRTKLREKGTR